MTTTVEKMKFLIVDDMTNMRRTIRNMLRYSRFTNIEEANDGDVAFEKMKKDQPDFVIADWNMPRMSGIDLVRKIRETELLTNIPILMVTAEVLEAQIVHAAESDIDGYIIKPFIAKTLEEKIKGIIERRNSPTEFDLLIKGGINFRNKGEYDKAIAAFEKALEKTPKSARVRHFIGETCELRGDIQRAEKMLLEAAKINPQYLKVHQSLSNLYRKKGETEKAITSLEQAARISPNNAHRQTNLGKLYLVQGSTDKAEKSFKKAVTAQPNDAALKAAIGEIFLERGHAEQAADAFKSSLGVKVDVHVYNRLGIALRRKGKANEAITEYKKALRISPKDEGLYYNIGRAYVEAKDKKNAVLYFKKALEISPDFKDAKVILEKIR